MRNAKIVLILFAGSFLFSCSTSEEKKGNQPVYQDVPFLQEYSIKYNKEDETLSLRKVYADRNNVVQVISSNGWGATLGPKIAIRINSNTIIVPTSDCGRCAS